MIVFTNHAAQHLVHENQGNYIIQHFKDGEIFVRVNEDLKGKNVWLVAATQPPATNLIELFFLLDAIQRAGASIHLFIVYFSYARQTIARPGEAHSAAVICSILKNFALSKTLIMHPHNVLLHELLPFEAVYDLNFFCQCARDYDTIAAPDKGALPFAQKIAQACNKNLVMLTKIRPGHDEVKIVSVDGEVSGKKVLLIDDVISTGSTLVAAAQELKKYGAVSISAAATHGIFAPGSREFIEKSILEHVFVTNTIAQQSQGKITIVDISKTITSMMQSE